MIRLYWFFLLVLFFLAACRKGDKVPSYIEIPGVSVVAMSGSGTSTSKITDVWVYANDQLLGTWELPARIPIIAEGTTKIQVSPAVKRNGMYDDRARYPFYTWWTEMVDLQLKASIILQPQVAYEPDLDIWSETFEDPGFQFIVAESSDTTLIRFTPAEHPEVQQLEGSAAAGGWVLDQAHPYMRIYTDEDFPATGGPMFLEVDFSTNVALTMGVLFLDAGQSVSQPFVYLSPTVEGSGSVPVWNKVYIDLSPIYNLGIAQRDIYFEATAPSGGVARVYLDNVKLVRNQ
ncbi:MAG: hypothetical protein M3R08_00210 [Bacteroidota bacterium]|nr:hypothetical protein [Bacteroidota bacterium]